MSEEFEGDPTGAVFWGAGRARCTVPGRQPHGCHDLALVDVEIDAFIDRVVVNGVDVTAFVDDHDRWYLLRFGDPKVMGRTVAIHPLVVLVVTVLGGLLGGMVGLILAVSAYVIATDAISLPIEGRRREGRGRRPTRAVHKLLR